MGLLGGLFKGVIDVVTLPVAAAVDVVTLGEAGASEKTLKKIGKDLEEASDGLCGNDNFI